MGGSSSGAGPPRLLPARRVLLALLASALSAHLAGRALGPPEERSPLDHLLHVALGGVCLLGVAVAIWRYEPELLEAMRAARRGAKERRD